MSKTCGYVLILLAYCVVITYSLFEEIFSEQLPPCSCISQRKLLSAEISTESCNMICLGPPLWPYPQNMTHKNTFSFFNKDQIVFRYKAGKKVKSMLKEASSTFLNNVPVSDTDFYGVNKTEVFNIRLFVADNTTILSLKTDESYSLNIRRKKFNVTADIRASSFWGARHGLETLSQLIWVDSNLNSTMILDNVQIMDRPSFPYRGLMVDTARNFVPLELLERVVDGMAACKLNILHLHLTDSVSFPISLPSVKGMAETGAYGPNQIYTSEDIKQLRAYALVKGIRLVLEVDAPSHVYQGWNNNLVICGEKSIFDGHLNPDNPEALNTLEKIYKDLIQLNGQNELFHIGNDEVDPSCWRNTEEASKFADLYNFWANYTNRMINRLEKANNGTKPENIIMWSSPLTSNYYYKIENKENLVIEFWLGDPYYFLLHGIKVIYATVGHWYLDCGFGPWKVNQEDGVCDPYTGWKKFYSYRPWIEYGYKDQALGGEACLWTEEVGEDDLETRIWPRTAAFAERMWSDPIKPIDVHVAFRLAMHRERLISRGLKAAAIWPQYCNKNPLQCI